MWLFQGWTADFSGLIPIQSNETSLGKALLSNPHTSLWFCRLGWVQQKAPQTRIHTEPQGEFREQIQDEQVGNELWEETHSKGTERKNRGRWSPKAEPHDHPLGAGDLGALKLI